MLITSLRMVLFAVVGTLVDSRADWSLRVEHGGMLLVDGDAGVILKRGKEADLMQVEVEEVVRLGPEEFVMPGLIDAHIHASQFPNAGSVRARLCYTAVCDSHNTCTSTYSCIPVIITEVLNHTWGINFPSFQGLGLDLPLLGWLQKYTFPMESRFHDVVSGGLWQPLISGAYRRRHLFPGLCQKGLQLRGGGHPVLWNHHGLLLCDNSQAPNSSILFYL